MSYTKELILEIIPPINIAEKLSKVKEVEVICAGCFDDSIDPHPSSDVQQFLSILAKPQKPDPLRVRAHLTLGREYSDLCQFASFETPSLDPITYEIFNLPMFNHRFAPRFKPLWVAFCLRAVVHFRYRTIAGTLGTAPHVVTAAFGDEILDAFQRSTAGYPVASGRLYLCDIPRVVLTPQEYAAAIDINETALRKLYDKLDASPFHQKRPSWKDFNTMVNLVEPGFRPSLAELTEGRM
jgi:hypothetical protein